MGLGVYSLLVILYNNTYSFQMYLLSLFLSLSLTHAHTRECYMQFEGFDIITYITKGLFSFKERNLKNFTINGLGYYPNS